MAGIIDRPALPYGTHAEDPPDKRGLVVVDGVDGHVVAHMVEDNPEDWSELVG